MNGKNNAFHNFKGGLSINKLFLTCNVLIVNRKYACGETLRI